MKKIYASAGFSPNYDQNGISDDQAETYIDTDPNENSTIAGIRRILISTVLKKKLHTVLFMLCMYLYWIFKEGLCWKEKIFWVWMKVLHTTQIGHTTTRNKI